MWGENVIHLEPEILGAMYSNPVWQQEEESCFRSRESSVGNHFKMSKGQVMDHDFSLIILLRSRKYKILERPQKEKVERAKWKEQSLLFIKKKKKLRNI